MAKKKDAEFEALAARLTDPQTVLPKPANVASGDEAAAAGREFMLAEYGSQEALDEQLRQAGRPKLGHTPKGASPTVRGRVAEADRAAFDQLIAQTGKKESELVREAVQLLLERHHLLAS